MYYGISSYEERIKKPYLSLIDWEHLLTHPEHVAKVWEAYMINPSFRFEVKRRLMSNNPLDQIFKTKFYEYFGDLLEQEENKGRT